MERGTGGRSLGERERVKTRGRKREKSREKEE